MFLLPLNLPHLKFVMWDIQFLVISYQRCMYYGKYCWNILVKDTEVHYFERQKSSPEVSKEVRFIQGSECLHLHFKLLLKM
jgi:hypothetical protein